MSLVPSHADFVAFIDDDETADSGWLDALLTVQRQSGATVVTGPVKPQFQTPPAPWMEAGGFFSSGPFSDGARLDHAITANCLIDKRALDALRLRFDTAFSRSGGGAHEFFHRLMAAGNTIVAARNASVNRYIPEAQMALSWVLGRQFRNGNTLGRLDRDSGQILAVLARLTTAAGRFCVGAAQAAVAGPLSRTEFVRGLAKMVWSAGVVSAIFWHAYETYGACGPTHRPNGRMCENRETP